ncbi:MAG: GNAT family N-acetyltransferase [Armatimonadetes bacterium]|nr:GNAT family N-acetyltransferase [Armatimonadota bacterium]
MTDCTYTLEIQPAEEEIAFFDVLREYNEAHVGDSGLDRLVFFARDRDGQIVGGLRGMTAWSWLHVTILVVKEGCRKRGIGRRLLAEAEQEAARRGCIGVHVETTSFQALPFYQKQGYTIFGELKDMPPGHTCYFLKKTLRNM